MSTEPQLGKYVPLKMAVSFASDELDKSEGDQDRFWLLALRGLLHLNFQFSAEPETFRIPLNGNKTANFPSGCLGWTKIGVLNNEGEISTLKINNGLSKWRDQNPNRIALLTPDINDTITSLSAAPLFLNYYYNNSYCNLYGVGNGLIQYGSCTVDDANELVVLDPDFRFDSIMFEGIFAPQREDDYKIPLVLLEPVIAFIKWKLKLGAREEFYAAATEARRNMPNKKVTLQQVNQVIREPNGMKLRS